ncbi:MAG: cell division protein ZapA [Sumerlaeia bacterium]
MSESLRLVVAGHEIRLNVEDEEEKRHVESAAKAVGDLIKRLSARSGVMSPAKAAAMAALQFAVEASVANEMADDARQYCESVERHKELTARMQGMLHRVEEVLEETG